MEIYLDNAATSHPKPPEVIAAVHDALTQYNGNPGRSGHKRALAGARQMNECRERLAQLLGVTDPNDIAFCFNCTDALNLGIRGILQRGDHVISTVLEHNSVLRVLGGLQQTGQIELTLLSPQGDFLYPEQFEEAIRPNTRIAVMTQVSNVTGAIQPVAAICEQMNRHGIYTLVDGAQGIGHLPVSIPDMGCTMYAFPGHKGLLGPQGTGGLYCAASCLLRPLREGGTGSTSDQILQPSDRPDRYESGTMNLPGICGLKAGIELLKVRQQEYMRAERALTQELLEGLRQIKQIQLYGPADEVNRVGVVSFNLDGYDSSYVADLLAQEDIAVRGGLHCAPGVHRHLGTIERGAVRVSIGHANTSQDIEGFLKVLRKLI